MYVIFAFPVTENVFDTDASTLKFQDKPNSPPEGRLPDATKGEYSWNILLLETVVMCACVRFVQFVLRLKQLEYWFSGNVLTFLV